MLIFSLEEQDGSLDFPMLGSRNEWELTFKGWSQYNTSSFHCYASRAFNILKCMKTLSAINLLQVKFDALVLR